MAGLPKGQKAIAIKAWHVNFPDPLVLSQGGQVNTHHSDDDFPGWIWCTQTGGKQGWVPESWLTSLSDTLAVAKQDYNAVELEVHPGDNFVLHQYESAWYWATRQDGQTGWVPADCLEIVET